MKYGMWYAKKWSKYIFWANILTFRTKIVQNAKNILTARYSWHCLHGNEEEKKREKSLCDDWKRIHSSDWLCNVLYSLTYEFYLCMRHVVLTISYPYENKTRQRLRIVETEQCNHKIWSHCWGQWVGITCNEGESKYYHFGDIQLLEFQHSETKTEHWTWISS